MAVLVPRWLRRNRFAVVVATVAVFMLCTGCAAASNARSTDTYGAAVLEMVPAVLRQSNVTTTAATALMLQNVATMSAAAAKARTHGADILVTPEMAVCGFPFVDHTSVEPYLLELPAPGTALCSHDNPTDAHPSSVLEALGCMAADSNLTVVVGLPERLPCTAHPTFKCPPVGYHKTHLFEGEKKWFDVPVWGPEYRFFDTTFGVRFGQFVCFDVRPVPLCFAASHCSLTSRTLLQLFFHEPEVAEAYQYGIQHFVFSTSWVNTALVPLMAATQLQQAFSRSTNVTLLASNYGVSWKTSGSGIYSNGEVLNVTFNVGDTPTNRLLLARVPKQPQALPDHRQVAASHGDSPAPATKTENGGPHGCSDAASPCTTDTNKRWRSFQTTAGRGGVVDVSSGDVLCRVAFNVSFDTPSTDTFAVFAWQGRGFSNLLPLRLCGVAVCPEGSCSRVGITSKTAFDSLSVQMLSRNNYTILGHTTGVTCPPVYTAVGGLDALPMSSQRLASGWSCFRTMDMSEAATHRQPGMITTQGWAELQRGGTVVNNVVMYQQGAPAPPLAS